MKEGVLVYVQHLLGIGHLVRTARIADALSRVGLDVTVVSGGLPVDGIDWPGAFIQLPPLAAGPKGFSDLVGPDGTALTEAGKVDRRDRLIAAWRSVRPAAVLIEMFPFGRRQMAFELVPWLETIRSEAPETVVAVSVRDILQTETRPDRRRLAIDRLKAYVDLVLVHGEADVTPLAASFGPTDEIDHLLHYTGYVGPPAPAPGTPALYDVVISVGGGAVGGPLVAAAIDAKHRSTLHGARWLAVTGPNMPAADRALVSQLAASAGIEVATFRRDLPELLQTAEVVICQAGYNTVAEVLSGRARAVLVPFTAGGETEQRQRALSLAADPAFAVVPPEDVDASRLARAVDAVMGSARRQPASSVRKFDGAVRAATTLADRITRRR